MWKSVELCKFGDDAGECLRVVEHEAPPPCPPEGVRVRVAASSCSFTDIMVRRGLYRDAPAADRLPFAPGYDLVGTVEEIGARVSCSPPLGSRVAALTVWGSYTQQYICLEPQHLVPVPDGLDDGVAVSLILAYMTAAQMLWRCGLPQDGAGKKLLVHGASGSVGAALTQLAKLQGFHVTGSASASKHEFCKTNGCDEVFDYRDDWVTGREGTFHAAFDMSNQESFQRSHTCLKENGILIVYGFYDASLDGGVTMDGVHGRPPCQRAVLIFILNEVRTP